MRCWLPSADSPPRRDRRRCSGERCARPRARLSPGAPAASPRDFVRSARGGAGLGGRAPPASHLRAASRSGTPASAIRSLITISRRTEFVGAGRLRSRLLLLIRDDIAILAARSLARARPIGEFAVVPRVRLRRSRTRASAAARNSARYHRDLGARRDEIARGRRHLRAAPHVRVHCSRRLASADWHSDSGLGPLKPSPRPAGLSSFVWTAHSRTKL